MAQVMRRRQALSLSGVVLAGALAGCLGRQEAESRLEDGDLTAIEDWIADGVEYGRTARFELNIWLEEPDKMSLADFESVTSGGERLLTRWDTEIEPVQEEVRETSIDRTVNENSWTVAGSELFDTMASLRDALDELVTSIGIVIEVENPDKLTDEQRSRLESAVEDGQKSIDGLQRVWFEGGV